MDKVIILGHMIIFCSISEIKRMIISELLRNGDKVNFVVTKSNY